jgi:hypothetical protein
LFGGNRPSRTAKTEKWNGTSWTEINDLNAAIAYPGGAGSTTAALSFGGDLGPASTANAEEFTDPVLSTKTVDID